MSFSKLILRKAKLDEGPQLTDLCLRSKSHWGYSQEFLERCRPFLTITNEYIHSWPVIVAERDFQILGFYSLRNVSSENRLDNLWVDQPFIGQGLGKKLIQDSFVTAKKLGWDEYFLASEPKAISFYGKFGGKVIGQIQSRLESNLFLPHIQIKFNN